jgi:hypothetical protein
MVASALHLEHSKAWVLCAWRGNEVPPRVAPHPRGHFRSTGWPRRSGSARVWDFWAKRLLGRYGLKLQEFNYSNVGERTTYARPNTTKDHLPLMRCRFRRDRTKRQGSTGARGQGTTVSRYRLARQAQPQRQYRRPEEGAGGPRDRPRPPRPVTTRGTTP